MPASVRDPQLQADDFVVYPVSSKTNIMPLEPSDYTYSTSTSSNVSFSVHTFILNNINVDLYAFAIWGRVFATDGQEASLPVAEEANTSESSTTAPEDPSLPDSSTVVVLNSSLLMAVFILLGRYYL